MSTKLRAGTMALAIKIQEAMDSGDSLSANDIRTRLNDALQDQYRGSGHWAYLIDSFGDAESGDVIYSCDGDTFRASYEMSGGAGAQKCIIDFDKSDDVVPRTIYETEEDEGDHMAAMEEAKREKLYGPDVPLYERFVSKAERDKASSGDFAGKGKSFPILKAADVSAAASSIGRAGSGNYSTDVIKKNIIRIAKAKGWTSELPKAWQGGEADAKESRRLAREAKKPMKDCPDCEGTGKDGEDDCDTCDGEGKVPMAKESRSAVAVGLRLVESAATLDAIRLTEARADYEIKLIAPGLGSSAYYPKEVLQRDGPKVFKAGTHVYLNHQTAAEEAARPEGDVKNLAGVLTTDAVYHEAHAKGPGLYGRMKVFADHAQTVEEKAPHVGMSIRASGIAESGKQRDGRPVLKELTSAESVDVVTRAGAGGMILTESARGAQTQEEASMDAEELNLLRESVSRLSSKETRREAIQEGARILSDVSLPDAAKEYIIETVLKEALPMKDGALDAVRFTESVNAEAKRFGGAIGVGPKVTGMGAGAPVEMTEAQRASIAAQEKAEVETYKESWSGLLGGTSDVKILERAMKGRVS